MRLVVPPALLLVVLAAAPLAPAHGSAEANELEVEVLRDEANDLNDLRGGWDVTQVFLGEAHDPAIGAGGAGDALYWRAELYGLPGAGNPLAEGEWRAVFTFTLDGEEVAREIRTTDGKAFETDFDALSTRAEDGILHVERAAIALAGAGLAPGSVVEGFRVETFVGGEPRDRAPGGFAVAGPVETPDGTERLAESYALTGPGRYVGASLDASDGGLRLVVKSLLKEGSQHVAVRLPEGLASPDPAEANLKPGEAASFRLAFAPGAPDRFAFDVTTDIGGRLGLVLVRDGDRATLVPEGAGGAGDGSAPPESGARSIPAAAVPAALAALAVVAFARRRD